MTRFPGIDDADLPYQSELCINHCILKEVARVCDCTLISVYNDDMKNRTDMEEPDNFCTVS